jgi:hypothetical protein
MKEVPACIRDMDYYLRYATYAMLASCSRIHART